MLKFVEKYLVVSVEKLFEFQNQSEPHDFKLHSFPIFLIFRSQAESDNGHQGGDVAKDAGRKEVER